MTLDPGQLVGREVGGYRLERLLGEGGYAWVFTGARDNGVRRAVKVLKPRFTGDPAVEPRFRREVAVAARLVHPNIVRIHDVGTDQGLTYFTMDLHPDSLAALIDRDGCVPDPRLAAIALDIAAALGFAHRAGIIHRDLKGDNILLRDDGRAVLTDFGIARAVLGHVATTGGNMTIGTPHYISPEQAQGRPLDGRSDFYSLGVTLYKAATGDLPFRSTDWFELARMHVETPPAPPSTRRPGISAPLERVIVRCLAKHPDDRYATAKALAADLRRVVRAPAPLRPLVWMVVVVVVALLVALLGTR
jgi:serine/threonine protein kinase